MATEIMVLIPETISVEVKVKLASLETKEKIKNLAVSLEKGNCMITAFLGNAHLKTTDGNIEVMAKKEVSGKAVSRNGSVENTLPEGEKFLIESETFNGNIYMLQTK